MNISYWEKCFWGSIYKLYDLWFLRLDLYTVTSLITDVWLMYYSIFGCLCLIWILYYLWLLMYDLYTVKALVTEVLSIHFIIFGFWGWIYILYYFWFWRYSIYNKLYYLLFLEFDLYTALSLVPEAWSIYCNIFGV